MNKTLIVGLSAAMMMTASGSVFAEEAMNEQTAMKVNYGITMKTPDASMDEEIEIITNGESAKGSLKMNMDGMELSCPDYMLATPEKSYLNAKSLIDLIGSAAGTDDLGDLAAMVGITEDWMELEPIDVKALDLNLKPFDVELPEFSEEMMQDASALVMGLVSMDMDENGMVYSITDESLKASAAAIDEFKGKYLSFVGDILTYGQDLIAGLENIDVKPAIRNYLDAAAEGYLVAVEGSTQEEAAMAIDTYVDSFVSMGVGALVDQVKAIPVADLWNAFSVESLMANVPDFEAKLMAGENYSYEITVEGQVIHGELEPTNAGFQATIYQDDELIGTMETTIGEEGAESVLKDADGNVISSSKCNIKTEDDNVDVLFEVAAPAQDVEFTGYFQTADWEDDGSLAAPEVTCSSLDVVKNVSALFFQMMAQPEAE